MLISIICGTIIGFVGTFFHILLDMATEFRTEHSFIIWLLPISGLLIVWLYNICGMGAERGTNGIIKGARGELKISLKTAPLIIAATALTHLFGGSAGREGAALQLGGSLASSLRTPFKLAGKEYQMLIMCGMSAGFSALFGTPAAAAIFAIEVTVIGITHYSAIVPCVMSALIAKMIADKFGVAPTAFSVSFVPQFNASSSETLLKVIIMGFAGALMSILFCKTVSFTASAYKKYLPNQYLRIFVGGAIVAVLSQLIFMLTGSYDYNGAGTDIITAAFTGSSRPEAFLLKMIFTALTLGAGFRGGEIVPTLFIGSTFGCAFGSIIGLSPSFGAALGLAAVFCGVTNCPFATLILSIELFGTAGLPYYALIIGMSYTLSGYTGLYSAQKFYDRKSVSSNFYHTKTYREIKKK